MCILVRCEACGLGKGEEDIIHQSMGREWEDKGREQVNSIKKKIDFLTHKRYHFLPDNHQLMMKMNRAQKKVSDVLAWENSQKAAIEARLRKIEEKLEKKKAEYGEKMKNKVAAIHKQAEEKRAMVEAKRGEELLKAEEMAAKYRATGIVPKATCGCF